MDPWRVVTSWQTFVVIAVLGIGPGVATRILVKAYPRDDQRRDQIRSELYSVPYIERPLWLGQQIERAVFEGLPARWRSRRLRHTVSTSGSGPPSAYQRNHHVARTGDECGFSAHDIADALRERLPEVGPSRLHLLLYLCQGLHLAEAGEQMFDECVEAWSTGPVVATFWRNEKMGIRPRDQTLDESRKRTVEQVAEKYGDLSRFALSRLTLQESPWSAALSKTSNVPAVAPEITLEAMRAYFAAAA